jgi:hypothetical protein
LLKFDIESAKKHLKTNEIPLNPLLYQKTNSTKKNQNMGKKLYHHLTTLRTNIRSKNQNIGGRGNRTKQYCSKKFMGCFQYFPNFILFMSLFVVMDGINLGKICEVFLRG